MIPFKGAIMYKHTKKYHSVEFVVGGEGLFATNFHHLAIWSEHLSRGDKKQKRGNPKTWNMVYSEST